LHNDEKIKFSSTIQVYYCIKLYIYIYNIMYAYVGDWTVVIIIIIKRITFQRYHIMPEFPGTRLQRQPRLTRKTCPQHKPPFTRPPNGYMRPAYIALILRNTIIVKRTGESRACCFVRILKHVFRKHAVWLLEDLETANDVFSVYPTSRLKKCVSYYFITE